MGIKWSELKSLIETKLQEHGVDDAEIDFIDISTASVEHGGIDVFYGKEDGLAVY